MSIILIALAEHIVIIFKKKLNLLLSHCVILKWFFQIYTQFVKVFPLKYKIVEFEENKIIKDCHANNN